MPDCCCQLTDRAFSEQEARAEAQRFRRHGPPAQTRVLLEAVRAHCRRGASLIDVGGGIGAIHHELLDDVADTAVHVDASSAYLEQAKIETSNRGHEGRVTFHHADFVDVASDLHVADIVTMDRVVCCYPHFHALLSAAARRSRHLLAMSYPRQTWYTWLTVRILNAIERLHNNGFRSFVHPVHDMEQLLAREGLRRIFKRRLFVWEVALYSRHS